MTNEPTVKQQHKTNSIRRCNWIKLQPHKQQKSYSFSREKILKLVFSSYNVWKSLNFRKNLNFFSTNNSFMNKQQTCCSLELSECMCAFVFKLYSDQTWQNFRTKTLKCLKGRILNSYADLKRKEIPSFLYGFSLSSCQQIGFWSLRKNYFLIYWSTFNWWRI